MRSARGIESASEKGAVAYYVHTVWQTRFARRGMIVFDRDTFSESMIIVASITFYRLIFRARENIEERGSTIVAFSFNHELFAQCNKFFVEKILERYYSFVATCQHSVLNISR